LKLTEQVDVTYDQIWEVEERELTMASIDEGAPFILYSVYRNDDTLLLLMQ
jgi:hypothetical protein